MYTRAQLVTHIDRIVQDSSYTDLIPDFINRARREIAGRVLLPALRSSDTVNTVPGSYAVNMPDDYQRELFHCYDTTQSRRVKVYRSFNLLSGDYPHEVNKTGALYGVAVEKNKTDEKSVLRYLRSPSDAHALRVHYFAYPTDMDDDSDVPYELPEHLQYKLIVNHVVAEMFFEIYSEDPDRRGTIGLWEGKKEEAIADLELYIGPYAREPEPVHDVMDWNEIMEEY